MDKVVKVEERLVPQKFAELPVSYAAELFARSCRECFSAPWLTSIAATVKDCVPLTIRNVAS